MEAGGKKTQYKRGLWTVEEDRILMDYIKVHGKGKWNQVAKVTGLKRCGKSCRLRWMNYLSPSVKRGDFSEEENDLIIRLHKLLGNRWSLIAGRVPGRTDNQVKNHWNTHLSKKLGVKKGKSRVGASSSSFSRNLEEIFTNPSSSNNVPPPHFADEPTTDNKVVMMEDGANDQDGEGLIAGGGCSTQGLTMSHDQNSFWFSCNDNYYVHSPNLLDFLDYESFDSLWLLIHFGVVCD